MSNKFRNIQTKILELDNAAKNELDEGLYTMIRDRLITPMSSYLFHLHVAYENGRQAKQVQSYTKRMLKQSKKPTRKCTCKSKVSGPYTFTNDFGCPQHNPDGKAITRSNGDNV